MTDHKSYEAMKKTLEDITQKIPVGSVRYHRKNPDHHYLIIDMVIDEATDSTLVIYERTPSINGVHFARLTSIFLEELETANGHQSRFVQVK
ncbi:MAG: DUF1653 domain-containing protein [bacterium]|nr:DUF1653 domain-containing protein [bacterium]